jgi:hypothetical protein
MNNVPQIKAGERGIYGRQQSIGIGNQNATIAFDLHSFGMRAFHITIHHL